LIRISSGLTRFAPAAEGLAAELRLLDGVARDQFALGVVIWQTSYALVVPSSMTRRPHFNSAALKSAEAGWPVYARQTGGGTVPQGPGVLNLAISFRGRPSQDLSLRAAYQTICAPIIAALAPIGINADYAPVPGSFCNGDFNLAVAGQKLVGTAQRWRRISSTPGEIAVLAHALILYDLPLAPAVSAINAFHKPLGLNTDIQAGAHTTIRSAALQPENCPDPEQLSAAIMDHCRCASITRYSRLQRGNFLARH